MAEEEKVTGSSSSSSSSRSGRCKRIGYALFGVKEEKLEECVNGFSEDNFIGKFQFGDVYRGIYKEKDVIVKVWNKQSSTYEVLPGDNEGRFEDEILLHNYFSWYEFHPNVAKLREYCRGGKYLAAIYYPNPKAIDTLHNLIEKDTFTWEQRIKVAFAFASLLSYMHTPHPNCPSRFPYLIRNIDDAHILVDEDHEPLLFDFSMISGGILTDKRDLLNQCIEGCCGYSDPNFAQHGEWSDKCDVFSYGVLLLSLISKRIYKTKMPFLYQWAKNERKPKNSEGCSGISKSSLVHQGLGLHPDFDSNDAIRITDLAMLCVEYDPQKRPTMKQVVKLMQKLHIVQHNANRWECCKMIDGVNEVIEARQRYSRRRGRLSFNPSMKGTCKNRGSDQSQTRFRTSIGVNNVIEVFSYEDLSKFTGGFRKENLIGEFQYGRVFRGMVKETNVIVKIWEINKECYVCGLGNKDRIKDEISLLQHPKLVSHPNLVKMIGDCFEEEKLGAVYGLDPHDSLHNLAVKDEFTWLQRTKVIYEFANLLEFLHAPNPPYAPYRVSNVDAAHIILDKEYSPKLLDFGATVGGIILSLRESRNLLFMGQCFGYVDVPGVRYFFYEDPDVFGYGIILLCLISKRIPGVEGVDRVFRPDVWAREEYNKWVDAEYAESGFSLVHEDLREQDGFDPKDGVALTKLGLDCVDRSSRCRRPYLEDVVKRLQKLNVIRGCAW